MDETLIIDAGFKSNIDALIDAESIGRRSRTWTMKKTFWSMVGQALDFNAPYTTAVKRLQATGRKCSSSNAGFSKARAKFPEKLLDQILTFTAGINSASPLPGKRVLNIDGVAITLNDTPENRAQYDTLTGQKDAAFQ
ncbi:MAG TPA: hypothetical protein VFD19_01565 [Clostridia bacterium]|nr:hypothetical protein [Clostridia bacterium]